MNPVNHSKRVSYLKADQNIKKTIQDKRRQEEMLLRKKSTRKKAVYIHREISETLDGYQTCGYDPTYSKGLNLVRNAFQMSQPKFSMKEEIKEVRDWYLYNLWLTYKFLTTFP